MELLLVIMAPAILSLFFGGKLIGKWVIAAGVLCLLFLVSAEAILQAFPSLDNRDGFRGAGFLAGPLLGFPLILYGSLLFYLGRLFQPASPDKTDRE